MEKENGNTNKVNGQPRLRTLYNGVYLSYFNQNKLDYQRKLYQEEKKNYTGNRKYFLHTLPLDNELIKSIEEIRTMFRNLWNTKRIPIGGNRKEDYQIIRDFKNLRLEDINNVLREDNDGFWNVLWDFSPFDSGLNQYFSEMMNVDTVNGSVIDCLLDENRNRFIYGYETKILCNPRVEITEKNFFGMFKQMCRISTNTQPVVNFPCKVGMWIISDSYFHTLSIYNGVPNDHFVVSDFCSGWGSRLLSTLCMFHSLREDYLCRYGRQLHVTYLSTDPNSDVHDRFENIVLDWFEFIEPDDTRRYFHLEKGLLECQTPEFLEHCKTVLSNFGLAGVNVSFTSPPYFNREKYSEDEGQSFRRYPTYSEWRIGFLSEMIKNVHQLLLPGMRFYLNISDTLEPNGDVNPMESDSCLFFQECGMTEVTTYKMVLSGKSDSKHKVNVGITEHKFEPVFVYQKSIQ